MNKKPQLRKQHSNPDYKFNEGALIEELQKLRTQHFNPDYKFNEGALIEEFQTYIDSTYCAHYGQGGLQSSEVIVDRGHGMGFFLGNVDKYVARYGKKGSTPAEYRKDLQKVLHYGLLALYEHDRKYKNNNL